MITRTLLFFVCAAGAATTSSAQVPPSANASQLGGPVVPGVCLLSREAVFANAAVGQAAATRLTELTQQAQAEVEAERQPIETDAQAFQAEAAGLSAETRLSRQQVLGAQLQAVQAKAALRGQEIEATRQSAMERIAVELQPVIVETYGARGCGLLLDRNSALGGNFTNDLTAEVVQKLDGRIRTLSFDRVTLSAPAAGAGR